MTLLGYPSLAGVRPPGRVDEAAPSHLPDGAAASFVVLVTGSRYANDTHLPLITDRLRRVQPASGDTRRVVLRHGAAGGTDTLAAYAARTMGWDLDPYPAEWAHCDKDWCPRRPHRKVSASGSAYCPLAGQRRNKAMVDTLPRPDVVVAFPDRDATPGKSGTLHCLLYAIRQGLHIASVDGLLVKGGHR